MTGRDQYRRMLKETITPALHDRGWRGASGKYYMTSSAGHVGSLIISGYPKRSTAQLLHFHVHYGVVSRYLTEFLEGTGQESPSKPSYALAHDWFGELPDTFTIDDEADPLESGRQLLDILDDLAIPKVVASLDDDGLRRAVDGCPVGVGRGGARTLMEIHQGNIEEARARILRSAEAFGDDDTGVVFLRDSLHRREARAP